MLPAGAGACAQQHLSQAVVKATANSQNFILAVLALFSPGAKTGTAVPLCLLPASWKMTPWNCYMASPVMALLLHGNAHCGKLLLRQSVCRVKQPRWHVSTVCEVSLHLKSSHPDVACAFDPEKSTLLQTQTHRQRQLKVPSHAPPLLSRQHSRTRDWPVTIKDLEPAIAANMPVFYLHPQEQ